MVFPLDVAVINVAICRATVNDGKDDISAIKKFLDNHPPNNHFFIIAQTQLTISVTF